MVQFISNVIQKFGGRIAGSQQEKEAQEYTAEVLKEYCDDVKIESFKSPLSSHFESLKIFSIIYWFSLWLFTVNFYQKMIVVTAISGIGAILFIAHFLTYRHILDFLFPKQTSQNVIGNIEPNGKAKTTILLSGHIDSVYEFQWWYYFKSFGILLNTIAGFGFILLPVYFFLLWIYSFFSLMEGVALWPYYFFIAISPAALSLFFKHGEDPVDGALDNLSGLALAMEVGKVFSKEKLENTRIKIVSFGSEEPALRGSTAFAKAHKAELQKENAVLINFDTIKDKAHLTILTKELNTLVKYPDDLVHKMEQAFQQSDIPYKKKVLPLGATDGSAFAIHGLRAISIIGMNSEIYDPCYHTRLDNLEHIDPEGLEALKQVMVQFLKNWDQEKV